MSCDSWSGENFFQGNYNVTDTYRLFHAAIPEVLGLYLTQRSTPKKQILQQLKAGPGTKDSTTVPTKSLRR